MGRIATSVTMAAKSAGKAAKEAVKEAPAVVKKRAKPGQTVSDPERMAFPGIYKRPDIIAQEAASMVAPESPSMKELFGVTRNELYDISRGLKGNLPGELPGAAANPRGSEAAEKVMTKKNTQRLLDVLSEVERFPELMKGMDSWYTMVPLYQKAVEVLGAERAKAEYPIMNALMGMASPGSAVTTEIPRGTAAYYLQKQGRFPEFMTELGKPVGLRDPGLDPEILGVPGHPYHKTAQGLPMQRFLETGEMQMESPKVPMYIEASGVPETGFQTRTPVGDAHFVRGVGLADVRTNKGFAGSITTPEMTSIAPWWREKVAGELGIESVPAQARTWGAFAPQTGVDTPIGAPKLELIADDIMRAARRLNISPIEARDRWLRGEIRLGGDVGKAEGGSIGSPDVIPPIVHDLEAEFRQYQVGGSIKRAVKAASKAVKTYKTTDGYTFYELKNGKIVDNLKPKQVDMSWPNKEEFLADMEGTAFEAGDELGQRRAITESYGVPTQEKLIENITQFGEDDITKFYAARKKQLEDAQRRQNLSLVPAPSVMSPKEFQQFAEKGMIRFARDQEQELRDLEGGKSKFAELYLNWDDPASYDLADEMKAKGFYVINREQGPNALTYVFKDPKDVEGIFAASNPAQYGKAYGYSDEDIARFYWERGLGPEQYAKDMAGIKKPEEGKAKGGQVESRACEDFDRELGKIIDFHAKLGGLVKGYAKGGAVQMSNGGETPEQESVMDEIAYMSEALSPERESADSETAKKLRAAIKAGKVIATAVPKALAAPVVGVYGAATSGKFGTKEGVAAGERAAEEFTKPSEETIAELQSDPLAMEYLESIGKFMGDLETKYKLPPIMPELFGPAMGTRGIGTQVKGLAKDATGKVRDMAKELPPLPVGLSIQPVGKPVAEVIKPGKIKVPASDSGFYSALDKAAANLQRKQGTGEAFLSDIKKFNPSADELQDTGLADWLKSQKTVTKQDVIDYISGNKVEVIEKVRGEPIGEADFIKVGKLEQRISRGDPTLTDEELNWFETNKKKVMNAMFEDLNPEYNEVDLMIPGGKNYREIQLRVPGVKYTSSHYPQDKDMIAWLRVQDKTIDGKKTLVIEEVQSDLHQKGRDLGYRSKDIDESVAKKELADATEAANNLEVRYNNAVSDFILKSGAGELRGEANAEAVRNIEALKIQLDAARSVQKEKENLLKQPSDAPFKESWYQLALKRAMKYAADNDFDQVALVGAEEQIKRYQLSRKVDAIQVKPEGEGKRITVQIKTKGDVDFVIDQNGTVIDVSRTDFQKAVGKDLSDVVGKPMAKRLMEIDRGVIAGGDLDIGGKGMLKYYNEIYPKYLEKQYSKKYGVKPQRKDHIIGQYGPDDVEERETGEVDRFNRPTFGYLVRDRDTGEDVAYESSVEKALSEANKKAPSVPMWFMDVPLKLKSDVKIGQSYKKGGAVKMRNGGPIISAYNTIPDVTDAGALKLAAYEQELKRYA